MEWLRKSKAKLGKTTTQGSSRILEGRTDGHDTTVGWSMKEGQMLGRYSNGGPLQEARMLGNLIQIPKDGTCGWQVGPD